MNDTALPVEAEQLAELTLSLLEHCQTRVGGLAGALHLTVAEFRTLRSFGNDQALEAGTLASRVGLSPSRLTRILDSLVEHGYIVRRSEPLDRRIVRATLTAKGLRMRTRLREELTRTHAEILRLLPEGGAASVLLALQKLNEAMAEWHRD
jgi:DNA-binding MarR family transcriptional regulator